MARTAKLPYGAGSVYPDKSKGVWRGAITIDGRRHRVSGFTKTEAQNALGALRDRVNSGLPAEDATLGEWVAWWLEHVGAAQEKSGESTRENYRWALEQTSSIWSKNLQDLRAADVSRMLGQLATRKRTKPGTQKGRGGRRGPLGESALRRVRFALGVVLDAAIADGRLTVNVARPTLARIPETATRVRPRRSLTPQEAENLMEVAQSHRLGALVGVMLYMGLRPGEATGLTWDRVDLTKETLAIVQSRKMAPDGTMTIGDTKAESDRTIRIPNDPEAPVVDLLRAHQVAQKKERMASPVWEHQDLVFTDPIGDYIDRWHLRREVAALCKDAGIFPTIAPNELRHTAASLLYAKEASADEVSDFLGHKDDRMFRKHYFDPSVRPVIDLTEAQGRMLRG
jgi:integrase